MIFVHFEPASIIMLLINRDNFKSQPQMGRILFKNLIYSTIKHSALEEKNVLNYFHFINATDLTIIFGLKGSRPKRLRATYCLHVGQIKKSRGETCFLFPKSFG